MTHPGIPKKETPDVIPEINDTAVTMGFEFLPARKYDEDDLPAPRDAASPTATEMRTSSHQEDEGYGREEEDGH